MKTQREPSPSAVSSTSCASAVALPSGQGASTRAPTRSRTYGFYGAVAKKRSARDGEPATTTMARTRAARGSGAASEEEARRQARVSAQLLSGLQPDRTGEDARCLPRGAPVLITADESDDQTFRQQQQHFCSSGSRGVASAESAGRVLIGVRDAEGT